MYLTNPIQLDFADVVACSAVAVIALFAVNHFFQRQTVMACRIAVILLWLFGTYLAVCGGFVPGFANEPVTIHYPWFGVIRVVSIMAAESLCLYFILSYRNRIPSIRRLLASTMLFAILAVRDSLPTDMPGYMYANSNFIVVTFCILFFGLTLKVLGYAASFAARQRTA